MSLRSVPDAGSLEFSMVNRHYASGNQELYKCYYEKLLNKKYLWNSKGLFSQSLVISHPTA